jgi:hypothetical protein
MVTLFGVIVFELHGRFGHGDIDLYHRYAQALWSASPPLSALPLEYPPLSILVFSLTLFPPLPDYITVFGLWMLGLVWIGYLAFKRFESALAAEVFLVSGVVGGLSTLLGRFDIVPAMITVAAYWAARQRRFQLAYLLLGAGTLIKLYPLFLVPILMVEQWRALGPGQTWWVPPRPLLRSLGVFALVTAAGFALARFLSPDGWLAAISYNTLRPIQVESVPATLLWIGSWFGSPAWPDHSFHSFNYVGPLDGAIGALSTLSMAGGCLWVYWRQLTGRMTFARAMLCCVLVVICTSRVLSPQYLIWAIPLIVLVERDYDPLWMAVCVATTLIYPFAYRTVQLAGLTTPESYPGLFLALIGARNALLVVGTVRELVRRPHLESRSIELDEVSERVA